MGLEFPGRGWHVDGHDYNYNGRPSASGQRESIKGDVAIIF